MLIEITVWKSHRLMRTMRCVKMVETLLVHVLLLEALRKDSLRKFDHKNHINFEDFQDFAWNLLTLVQLQWMWTNFIKFHQNQIVNFRFTSLIIFLSRCGGFTSFNLDVFKRSSVHVVRYRCCRKVVGSRRSISVSSRGLSWVHVVQCLFVRNSGGKFDGVIVFIVIEVRDSSHGLLPRVGRRIAG